MSKSSIAIIGGGIAGLTASLRLAEQGFQVDVYESAPALGGRTKSFYDETAQTWVDNGPHMIVGAYAATLKLLDDVGASSHISWQPSLTLPLWEKERGFFAMHATSLLPVSLALLVAVAKMPNHDFHSVKAMLKLALSMKNRGEEQTVRQWLDTIGAPDILVQDMLEVLCLGVMNEPLSTANAKTFARVLSTSFSSHENARMGWFNRPLSQALVLPVAKKSQQAGVNIHLRHTVRDLGSIKHDAIILAMPAFSRNRLLGLQQDIATQSITNIHVWFEQSLHLPSMMLGMLGTYSQWLFDINAMLDEESNGYHYCFTISADATTMSKDECLKKVLAELQVVVSGTVPPLMYSRVIREKRATVLVRKSEPIDLPNHVFDACESPYPGQLPATIELAVLQGENAAKLTNDYLK